MLILFLFWLISESKFISASSSFYFFKCFFVDGFEVGWGICSQASSDPLRGVIDSLELSEDSDALLSFIEK